MNCLLAFVFLALTTWFFVVIMTNGFTPRSDTALDRVARRYGGKIERVRVGSWFSRPAVRFDYTETSAVIVPDGNRREGRFTDAWFEWADPGFRLHIVPTGRALSPALVRGLSTLDAAAVTFFWRYRVYCNQLSLSQKLLSDPVKWQIEQLHQAYGHKDVEIRFADGRLLIRKYARLRDPMHLENFVAMALRFYDQAMLMRAEGIEFLGDNEAQPIHDVQCGVCGDLITTDMVFCRRCKTPHHRECWEYFGACSVFGCQETQYITPRVASGS